MINNTQTLYDQKLKSLAEQYESQGFRVFSEPKTDELPFDLGNYQPDMIAIKDGSGLVIEVKTSISRVSVDRLQALAEEVSKHPGWRFLLLTLEDIEANSLHGTSEQLPSWQELTDRFHEAHRLIEDDEIQAFKAAFLLLWSTFEGALRKRAIDVLIPIERFPVIGLLRHLYSLGELSISQFDLAQACFEVRNRLAHGYIENLTLPVVHNFDNLVRELLAEWKVKLDISQLSSENLAAFRAWFAEFDAATGDKLLELTRNLINQKSLLLALELTRDLIINEKNEKQLNKELDYEQVINVEFAVSLLSPENLAAFRTWFKDTEFDAAAWDKQIEKDVAQQETLSSITDSPTLEPFTDLDPWTQSLIGVIQLGEENPTENYNEFLSLPAEAQRQVIDYIAFLRQRYAVVKPASQSSDIDLINDNFIGMWSDREDLADSTTWVRGIRENEWSKSHD